MPKLFLHKLSWLRVLGVMSFIMAVSEVFAGWTSTVVDDGSQTFGGYLEEEASMIVVNGNPAIVAFDTYRNDMIYRRAADMAGSTWGPWISVAEDSFTIRNPQLIIVDGKPAIAYYSVDAGEVRFVRSEDSLGNSWSAPVSVAPANMSEYEFQRLSVQIVNGRPAIAFASYGEIRFSMASNSIGSSWNPSTVIHGEDDGWRGNPKLLEVGGVPCIVSHVQVFQGNPPSYSAIEFFRASDNFGSNWNPQMPICEEAEAGEHVGQPTCAMISGRPAVCFEKENEGYERIVWSLSQDAVGTTWSLPTEVSLYGKNPELHENNGKPAVAFARPEDDEVFYVVGADAQGSVWGEASLLPAVIDQFTDLDLQMVDGHPTVLTARGRLTYCRAQNADGSVWGNPIFHSANGRFIESNVSLDSIHGKAMLAYSDGPNGVLKFAVGSNAEGSLWSAPRSITLMSASDPHCSLAQIGGLPSIAYKGSGTQGLRYISALDSEGEAWDASVSVKTGEYAGRFARLLEVNGHPAIGFTDGFLQDHVFYVRASIPTGSLWPVPIQVDAPLRAKNGLAFEIISGNPAFVFFMDHVPGFIRYNRATDTVGTNWSTPVSVQTTASEGRSMALATINGKPSVAYTVAGDGSLRIQQALNAEGSAWSGTPITLTSTAMGSGTGISDMAILNGKPIISYGDFTNSQMRLLRATNAEGTSWEAPEIVAESASPLMGRHLAIHNGQPMVAYYDTETLDLRVAVFQPDPFDDAIHVSDTIPSQAGTGHPYQFSITLQNSGNATWSGAAGYRLKKTQDTCGIVSLSYLDLPTGLTVSPGKSVVIHGLLEAPDLEGMCDLSFQMIRDGAALLSETETAFGPVISRTIQFVPFLNDASFSMFVGPSSLAPQQGVYVSVQAKNEGNTQWNTEDFQLSLVSDVCGLVQQAPIELPGEVRPNRNVMLTFYLLAPITEGNCDVQLRMEETGIGLFGGLFSRSFSIVVPANAVRDWRSFE